MPVDIVVRAVLYLAGINALNSTEPSVVYHVQNPRLFHWPHDLLPALRDAGLDFETVPQRELMDRLRRSEKDPKKSPIIKLLDFFADKKMCSLPVRYSSMTAFKNNTKTTVSKDDPSIRTDHVVRPTLTTTAGSNIKKANFDQLELVEQSSDHGDPAKSMSRAPEFLQSLSPELRLKLETKLRRKIDLRLMSVVVIMYILNYLDRNNIAAARLTGLEADLHLRGNQFQVR